VSQQKSPAMQSASVAHDVLHAFAPHTNGVHAVITGEPHVPSPLHVSCVCVPAAQVLEQSVPAGQSAHAPLLHLPFVPQVDAAIAAQIPRGSELPSIALEQVPFAAPVSALEQAWQALVHAALQQ
jgi:hypothetical protein